MLEVLGLVGPVIGGLALGWIAGKCRGRNARNAFRFASIGTWLLLLRYIPTGIPVLGWLLLLMPSVVCYYLALHWMMKEMRAQQRGEYTERA